MISTDASKYIIYSFTLSITFSDLIMKNSINPFRGIDQRWSYDSCPCPIVAMLVSARRSWHA